MEYGRVGLGKGMGGKGWRGRVKGGGESQGEGMVELSGVEFGEGKEGRGRVG